ncbi:MAG: SDR family oxidoreductase [Deltaproteobacteria bacterium]|nr:SDR family oxidoreductase [Deltaproteobacteria bacterium]
MSTSPIKVAVVTGANTGIGKETARGLAERKMRVVLAVRDLDKGEAARADIVGSTGNADVFVLPLDLGSRASIRAFAARFREQFERLDLLVNNAGVWTRNRSLTVDGVETTFGVNHLGTFLLTHELLPTMRASAPARIIVVSSDLHFRGKMVWDDLQFERRSYGGVAAYNQSKLANVLFAKALARRLAGTGITVNALHPGVVATELTRELPGVLRSLWNLFLLTPKQGASTTLHVALSEEGGKFTGEYFDKSRRKNAASAARDEVAQERLWSLTEKLLGTEPLPLRDIAAA